MATAQSELLPPVSMQVIAGADGGVFVQWTREVGPPHLLGWHLERQLSDGRVVRVTEERVEAGLFDSPSAVYRIPDAAAGARAGDSVSYRLVTVDPELREWPSDFAAYMVEAEKAVPAPLAPKPPRTKPAPALRDVTPSGSGSRLRIVVKSNGLYRLTSGQIAAGLTGFDEAQAAQAIAQTNLALSCGGTSVAWRAEAGGAALLFFGEAYRDVYTDRNVYFLEPGPGLAMASSNRSTAEVAADPWFWETKRAESNLYFQAFLVGGVEDDYFVWDGRQLTSPSVSWQWTTNVALVDLHPAGKTGTVSALLISGYDGAPALDNHSKLSAAGQLLDDRQWAGNGRLTQSGTATNLGGSQVSVTIELRRETNVTTTTVMIDALDVRYARRLRALNNQLLFRPEAGTNTLTVRGFTTSAIQVFDVANPLRPVELAATVVQEGASDWRASWSTDLAATGRFLAVAATLQPERIDGVSVPAWNGPMAGVPHLVIAPQAMANAASALVAHRQQQGMGSLLVSIEELYDAFAFGRRDPRAIQRFLAHARSNWTVPPAYVCLAGDGHLDYYDHFSQSLTRPNHVPPMVDRIPYTLGGGDTKETMGLDNALADMDGDGNPEIAIGRLPAQTPAALTAMINRIVIYEASETWKSKVLLVADRDSNDVFKLVCDRLQAQVPPALTIQRLNHTSSTTPETMRTNFIREMNAGAFLSVYVGHGNNVGLSSPYFFEHSSIRSYMSALTNLTRAPLLLAGTCILNNFARPHPNDRCLGKGFLDTAPGGAVGVWASAASSSLYNSELTTDAIFNELFQFNGIRLGDLIRPGLDVEAQSYAPWIVRASILMGDPGTRIRNALYTPIILQPTTTNLPADGAAGRQIAVASDVAWTSVPNQAWITITGGGSGSGHGAVTFNVSENIGAARSGSIFVSGGGTTRTCRVDQAAARVAIVLSVEPDLGGVALGAGTYSVGQSVEIVAAANQSWRFTSWNDGNTQNPRTIAVPIGGASYVANFEPSAGMWPSGDMVVVDRRPRFFWVATAGATWYQVVIQRNGKAYESKWVGGATTWTPTRDYQGGQYRWWVRPWGPVIGYGAWSGEARFLIPVGTPGVLAQIAPQGVQGGYNLTYRWQKHINATWYHLSIGRVGAGTWVDRWFELSGVGEAAVNPGSAYPGPAKPIQTAPQGAIGNNRPTFQWSGGACEWWVQGWGPDGIGPWSGPMAFSIPHAADTWYRVYASRGTTKVIDLWTQGTSLLSPVVLSAGSHSWWLAVWDAQTRKTIWSDRMDFTVP